MIASSNPSHGRAVVLSTKSSHVQKHVSETWTVLGKKGLCGFDTWSVGAQGFHDTPLQWKSWFIVWLKCKSPISSGTQRFGIELSPLTYEATNMSRFGKRSVAIGLHRFAVSWVIFILEADFKAILLFTQETLSKSNSRKTSLSLSSKIKMGCVIKKPEA